jgi:hypothetical protein
MEMAWIWKKSVIGKIEADGEFYFPNINVLWEYLCGTVAKKPVIFVRLMH